MAASPAPSPSRAAGAGLRRLGILVGAAALMALGAVVVRPPRDATALIEELALYAYVFAVGLVALALQNARASRREAALRAQSITDPLTGLCNRRYFTARLDNEVARSHRSRAPLALLLIDIDHLKEINDRGGHVAGDAVIRDVARYIHHLCRSTDVCARLGGDEFAVMAPATSAHQAVEIAQRLRTHLSSASPPTRDRSGLSVSIGVSDLSTAQETTPAALLGAADAAMYRAKAAGRDQIVISDPGRPTANWAPLPPATEDPHASA